MSSPSDRRRARGAETRESILVAASELLLTGVARTSMRAVADRASVPISLVHYHFKSKSQLLREVLKRQNAAALARRRAAYEADGELAVDWRAAIRDLGADDLRTSNSRILWELWVAGLEDEDLAELWREAIGSWRDLLADALARSSDPSGADLPIEPRLLTALVICTMMGAEAARLAAMPEEELPILEALAAVATLAQPAAELR
jgi:AcrR family transcriptional regulator